MDLLTKEKGKAHFILGNEAIVRGAIEAGVNAISTYPGTPASEIGDTFHEIAPRGEFYFEYSANEKVAFEYALGPALAGQYAMVAMKHVGLNVAADTLMTVAYSGVEGALVVVSADDPSCHSSQNEQDNRYFARLANIPMLEPSHPQEALEMVRYCFELSHNLKLPVLFRTTTRVNHMRAIVKFGDYKTPMGKVKFGKDPRRFFCVPAIAYTRHPVLLQQMEKAKELVENSPLNFTVGEGKIGVLTSGVSYNYVLDAASALGTEKKLKIFKLGFSHPIPKKKLARFLHSVDSVLVVEELEPYLEEAAKIVAQEEGLSLKIFGKVTGHFPYNYEFSTAMVKKALASVAGVEYKQPPKPEIPALPMRPPALCAGCPHRATFYASKLVVGEDAIFNTDIGCYALGFLPPLNMGDVLIDMGASISCAAGVSRSTNQTSIAYIGDSTFFHSGLAPLASAIHNKHKFILVIMDNRTTAMTGHQPHPASAIDGMRQPAPSLDIEKIVRSFGVEFIEVVDSFDLHSAYNTFKRAKEFNGISIVISRGSCALIDRARTDKRPRFTVSHDACKFCGIFEDHNGCFAKTQKTTQLLRSAKRFLGHPLGQDPAYEKQYPKVDVAPCTKACPANVCVQSYNVLAEGKHYVEAYKSVREFIPFPGVLGRVCDHPCEDACTMKDHGKPSVAIRAMKRFIADKTIFDDAGKKEITNYITALMQTGRPKNKKIAIIGGGPAGLTAGAYLRQRGYSVTIFEAEEKAGGLMRYGIPAYRLPREVLDIELELMKPLELEFRFGTRVGKDISFDELKKNYDGVFIGVGARFGTKLQIEGEETKGVYDAISFLNKLNKNEKTVLGKKIGIIGGGNAAMDAARSALRLAGKGATITVIYRRSEEEMPAIKEEIEAAKEEGIQFQLLTAPVRIVSSNGEIKELVCQKMKLGEPDKSGRRRPVPVEGSEFKIELDTLFTAIGQTTDVSFLPPELKRSKEGLIIVDEFGRTSVDNVFAGGDAVTGPNSVIEAIGAAKTAAYNLDKLLAGEDKWLKKLPKIERPKANDALYSPAFLPEKTRAPLETIALEKRVQSFEEVELNMAENEAFKEASRCVNCGSCAKCNTCVEQFACPALYIDEDNLISINDVLCNGCGACAQLCPNGAIVPSQATTAV